MRDVVALDATGGDDLRMLTVQEELSALGFR
jgi:hypothetical protein